jgi:hypothetical protein
MRRGSGRGSGDQMALAEVLAAPEGIVLGGKTQFFNTLAFQLASGS